MRVCDESCGHTIDVGPVHTLTDDGECLPSCPHPDHRGQDEREN